MIGAIICGVCVVGMVAFIKTRKDNETPYINSPDIQHINEDIITGAISCLNSQMQDMI